MTEIFKHTDTDGDRFDVWAHDVDGDPATLTVRVTNGGEVHAAYMNRPDVDRLRAALAPYGTQPPAVKPAERIEVGESYRLLPDARHAYGRSDVNDFDVTRVRVAESADVDGDHAVTPVDGTAPRERRFVVHARFLAPLDAPAPTELHRLTPIPTEADPLDPRRVAAIEKAASMLPGDTTGATLVDAARFLLGDE